MCGGNVEAAPADPEFGRVADGTYTNDYFRMSYPLPPGWSDQDVGAPALSGAASFSANGEWMIAGPFDASTPTPINVTNPATKKALVGRDGKSVKCCDGTLSPTCVCGE